MRITDLEPKHRDSRTRMQSTEETSHCPCPSAQEDRGWGVLGKWDIWLSGHFLATAVCFGREMPAFSQLQGAPLISWLMTPSSIFKADNIPSSNVFLTRTLMPPSSIYKDPCNYTGHTLILWDNLHISRSSGISVPPNLNFLCHIT